MTSSSVDRRRLRSSYRYLTAVSWFAVLAVAHPARAEKNDVPAAVGGGVMARVLAPTEKIKLLEEELAKESDQRAKLEVENTDRTRQNAELVASVQMLRKERAGLEAKAAEAHERENQLQRTNDRLREETERVTVSVRFALPIIAGIAIIILALIVWLLLFLRQVATRVHSQKTISEVNELEGRLIHTNDMLNAELKRSQALRQKLSELGVSD